MAALPVIADELHPASIRARNIFSENLPKLLLIVEEKLNIELRLCVQEKFCSSPELIKEVNEYFGSLLQTVYDLNLRQAFVHESANISYSLLKQDFDPSFFPRFLEAWIIAINSTIDPQAASELTQPLIWLSRIFSKLDASKCPAFEPLDKDQQAFLDLLLRQQRRQAAQYLLQRLKKVHSPEPLFSQIMIPALHRLGLLWQERTINVAAEHAATEICRYAILRLCDVVPIAKMGPYAAIVSCVPGEEHELGALIVANLLELSGFRVIYLGHSLPESDILYAIDEENPDFIFLSVTLLINLPATKRLIEMIQGQEKHPQVVLGGYAVQFDDSADLKPDFCAANIKQGIEYAMSKAGNNA